MSEIYKQLATDPSSVLGDQVNMNDKEEVIKSINTFLQEYPKTLKPAPNAPWVDLSLRDLAKQAIEVAIDIIEDISILVSQRDQFTNAEYRRQLVNIFFRKDRRLSVGLWLIVLSFILYFIDSAA
jgi:hypothetical protein